MYQHHPFTQSAQNSARALTNLYQLAASFPTETDVGNCAMDEYTCHKPFSKADLLHLPSRLSALSSIKISLHKKMSKTHVELYFEVFWDTSINIETLFHVYYIEQIITC